MHGHIVVPELTGSTFTARTETLQTYAMQQAVDMHLLREWGYTVTEQVMADLREELLHRIEKAGRLVVGEVVVVESDDLLRDCVWVRMQVQTRQSDQGEWASIWQAIREDGLA